MALPSTACSDSPTIGPFDLIGSRPGSTDVGGSEPIGVTTAADGRDATREPACAARDQTRRSENRESTPSERDTELSDDGALSPDEARVGSMSQWELIIGDETSAELEPAQQAGRLDDLAARIAGYRLRMERAGGVAIGRCIRIGEALIEAKKLAGHCRWARFLERCGLHPRTAQQYMRLARHRDEIERNAHGRSDLTIEVARKMIASGTRRTTSGPSGQPMDRSIPGGTGCAADEPLRTGSDNGFPTGGGLLAAPTDARTSVADPGEHGSSTSPPDAMGDESDGIAMGSAVTVERAGTRAVLERADGDASGRGLEPPGRRGFRDAAGGPLPGSAPGLNRPAGVGDDRVGRTGCQVSTLAPSPAGPVGTADEAANDPDELSDDDWLASIPLRARLGDTRHLDEEAILWRRLQPTFARIREWLAASPEEIRRFAYLTPDRGRLRVRLGFATFLRPPHEWELCQKCAGRCVDVTGRNPCYQCHGWGFFVAHEGTVTDEEGDGAVRSAESLP